MNAKAITRVEGGSGDTIPEPVLATVPMLAYASFELMFFAMSR